MDLYHLHSSFSLSLLEMLSYVHHKACISRAFADDLYGIHRDKCDGNFDAEKYPNIALHFGMIPRQELPLDREPD